MRYLSIFFCGVLVLFSIQQAQARIIHVPADSSTIQGGINGAVNGDTVLVAPGTYNEHINFNGKAILVTSEAGPNTTRITKVYDGVSIVSFISGEDTTSILDGFTITGGVVDSGGGIYSGHSSPTIRNNVITGNTVTKKGAGFCCQTGHPVLEANTIVNNTGGGGGGIFLVNCEGASVRNNFIKDNFASEHGGAIFLHLGGTNTVEKNLILSNSTSNLGGGVQVSATHNTLLLNNTIVNNASASGEGGGVCIWCSDSTTLLNNIIVGSTAGYGIYSGSSSNSVIEYNDVWNNSPGNYYGIAPGEGCISADPVFCDSANDNYYLHSSSPCFSAGQGGVAMGAFGVGCGTVIVTPGPDQAGPSNSQVSVVFYVQNNGDSADTFDLDVSDQLEWNIEPPHYELVLNSGQEDTVDFTVSIPPTPIGTVDSVRLDAVSRTDSLQRHWAYLSVSCDSFLEGVQVTAQTDTAGPALCVISVSFYVENIGVITQIYDVYVTDPLTWITSPLQYEITLDPGHLDSVVLDVAIPYATVGTTDTIGLQAVSQNNPFTSDSASLRVTCTSRIIHVPLDFSTIQAAMDFSSDWDSILVAPDTYYEHIFFNGKPIVVKSEAGRDSTTISKIAGGVSLVSFISGEDSNSVLDGFTITGGNLESGQGAGIRCQNASPTVVNNKIIDNTCPYGAGIDCDDYSSPLIAYNIIEENTATSQGGGIRCAKHSSPAVLENIIIGNSAADSGAGICCLADCSPAITGNLIVNNTAQTGYGGGIGLFNSSIVNITNNTVDKNSASWGGGIYIANTPSAMILNTIVTNSLSGKGIRNEGPFPTIIHCDVWNNLDENYYGCIPGQGCISADPVFCNPENDNYSLWFTSPCLGTGQGGSNIGAFGIGCDLVGNANADGAINIADVVYLINYLFANGSAPTPLPAGDVNCDGEVNIADVVYLINYLFAGGPPPCEP